MLPVMIKASFAPDVPEAIEQYTDGEGTTYLVPDSKVNEIKSRLATIDGVEIYEPPYTDPTRRMVPPRFGGM